MMPSHSESHQIRNVPTFLKLFGSTTINTTSTMLPVINTQLTTLNSKNYPQTNLLPYPTPFMPWIGFFPPPNQLMMMSRFKPYPQIHQMHHQMIMMNHGLPSPIEEQMHPTFKREGTLQYDRQSAEYLKRIRDRGGDRPYVCTFPLCQKSFTQLGNLKTHERKHTGEKPYKCSFENCDKTFSQMGNMKTHELLHAGVKPYCCSVDGCTRSFTQLGNLKSHQLKLHYSEKKCVEKQVVKKERKQRVRKIGKQKSVEHQIVKENNENEENEGEGDSEESEEIEKEVELLMKLKAVISKSHSMDSVNADTTDDCY